MFIFLSTIIYSTYVKSASLINKFINEKAKNTIKSNTWSYDTARKKLNQFISIIFFSAIITLIMYQLSIEIKKIVFLN